MKSNGGESGVRYFQTKEKAVAYSRDEAKSQGGELVIHGRSGKILKHHTYSAEQAGAAGPGAAKAGFGGAKELIVIKDDFESPIEDLSEYV